MRNLFLLLVFCLTAGAASAQTTAAAYSFSQSTGTYTAISGGTTAIATGFDDNVVSAIAIGFTFAFRGSNYTTVSINSNGWMAFGSVTLTSGTYTAISTLGGGSNGIVAASSEDLQDNSASPQGVIYTTTGSSPNRIFTVQWTNARHFGGTDSWNFQIKLYETSNIIQVCYGTNTTGSTTRTSQVGIRGTAVTDYNNRLTTSNWSASTAGTASTSTMTRTASINPPSGLIFSWCPSAARPTVTMSGSPSCTPASFTASGASTYSWLPVTSLSATSGASTTASPTSNTVYTVTGVATNGCSNTATATANVTPATISGSSALCTGATTTLSTTTTGGTWSSSAPGVASVTTGGVVRGVTAGSVNISYTMASGCYNYKTITVTTSPTVSVSPTTSNFCSAGSPVSLAASGATTYSWAASATPSGLSSASGSPVSASPVANRTYTVTGTDAVGCTATAVATVNRYISLTGIVPYVPSDTVICYPGYALMTEGGTGGTWSSSDASVLTIDASGNVTPVGTGNAKVYYTSPCGTDSLSIRVASGGFTVSVTPSSATYCASGGPVTLTASSSGGADQWLWTDVSGGPAVGLSATGVATVSASPSVTATYALFGTNSSTGCHAVTTATVTNVTPAAITGTTNVCVGSNRTYACATGGGTWSSSAPGVATVDASTGVITGLTAGSATISYTVTSTGCYSTRAITVNALPSISSSPSSPYSCGLAVALTASGATTYSWSPSTGLSATTGATVNASPTAATTYTITGTDANGCLNTATRTVNYGSNFVAPIIGAAADTVCPGATDVLTAQATTSATLYGVTSITYAPPTLATTSTITTGDDVTTTSGLPFTFNFFGTNYTSVNFTTNGFLNFGTASTLHSSGITIPNTTSVALASINAFYSDLSVGGSGYGEYDTLGSAPNRRFVFHTINGACCSGGTTFEGWIVLYETTNIVDVLVNRTESRTQICGIQNAAGTIGFAAPGRNGVTYQVTTPEAWRFTPPSSTGITYTWASGGTLSATTGTPVTATVTGVTTYTLTGTDPSTGCNGTVTKVVQNYNNPTVAIGPATVCPGTTMTATGASTYSWLPTSGLSATTGASVIPTAYVTTSYTVTGTDTHGCIGTATKNVSSPTLSVTPTSSIFCSAGSAVGLAASGTSVSYSWSPASGLSVATGPSVSASPSVTTTYTVTGTDGSGCTNVATANITYNATATSITAPSSTLCLPGTMSLTTNGTGGTWSSTATGVATVDPVSGLVTGVSAGSTTISYGNATCGYVTYGLSVANGGFSISVSPFSGTYCASGSAFSMTASDGGAGSSFTWSPASSLSSSTGATVSATPAATTTYTVVGSVSGCSNSTTITITNTTPAAIAGSATICAGSTTTYSDATGGGTWSSSAPAVATVDASTGVVLGAAAGSATITYTVTATGCYVTRGITVNALPSLSFTPAAASACGGVGVAVTAAGAVNYAWTPSTGLSATTGATVTATPASTTSYTITGTNAAGCVSTGIKTVAVGASNMLAFIQPAADTVCPGGTDVLTGQVASSSTAYIVSSISYAPPTLATTSTITTGDDVTTTSGLPFTFNFFGSNYSSVNFTTNGFLNFGTATTLHSSGITIPNTTSVGLASINAFYSDISVGGTGYGEYDTLGTAPNRRYVFHTINGPCCSGGNTFEGWVILYESSNVIDVLVNRTESRTQICGIQNAAGTIGFTPSGRNGVTYQVTTPEAWRFTPSFPTATYAWSPSSSLSATTGTPVTATVSGATTYTLTVTDPSSGCNGSFTRTINNYVNPTISVAPSVVCVGTAMTASGAATYSWSPATGLASTTGATVTPSSYAVTTYTVAGTDAHGCIGTTTKNISFPTVSVTPTSSIFCSAGSAVGLAASGTAVSYSWSPASGLSAATGASVNASPGATTTYTVTGTDGSGCTNVATANVTYNLTPTTITAPAATLCLPGTMLLTTDGTGGVWRSSDTGIATIDSVSGLVTGISAGTTTISYGNASCGYATYTLTVANGGFSISTTPGAGTYCASGSALAITASDGGAGASFTWSPASGLSATTGASVSASPSATTIYTVVGTAGACSNSTTITVTNNTPAAIAGSATLCTGLTTNYTNSTAGGTWSSSAPGVATVDASTGVITGVTAGSATITYSVTATGCYVTRSITVNAAPTLSFTPASATACGGVGVLVTASGASGYSWAPSTGLSAATGAAVTANPGSTTTYTITGTSAAGCVASATKSVTVGATAIVPYALSAPSTVCPGSTTSLTAGIASSASSYSVATTTYRLASFTSTGSVVGDDANSGAVSLPFTFNFYGVNYSNIYVCTNGWVSFTSASTNLTNYAFPSTAAPTSCVSLFMHDLATAGYGSTGAGSCTWGVTGTAPNRQFVIYYNGIGNYSGGATNTGQIILYETSNIVDVMITAAANGTTSYSSTVGIQNAAGTIAATASTYNGVPLSISTPEAYRFAPSFPTATYTWAPSTGVTSTASAVTTATVTATTTYTVTATDPASGCNGSFTTTVNTYTAPTVSISPTVVCAGSSMTAAGAFTYSWSPATGLSSTAGATVTPSPIVATTYTVTGVDTNGCQGTATKTISFPTISLSPSSAIYCSTGAPVSISASGSGVSYSWAGSSGLSATTGTSVSASPGATTIYTVTTSDASGCIASALDTITYNAATTAITASTTTLCLPGTLILTQGGSGGVWSSSDTTISIVNASGIVSGVSAGSSTITYNNPGCGGLATYNITNASGGFTISVTPSTGTYCSTGSALHATASGATTYVWFPSAGLDVTTGATVNASPTTTTVYTVTGTTSGCSNSATLTVTNNTPAPIAGGVTTLCSAVSGALSATSTTWTCATTGGVWSSSAPGVATVDATTGVITGLSSGTATITYNVSGCYVTRNITINASPSMSFTPASAAACGGASIVVTASGASSYSWSPAAGLSSTLSAAPVASPTVTTTYTVTGTSALGCVSSTTKLVTVSGTSMLAYATSSATSVCTGGTTTLTGSVAASSTAYNVSNITYSPLSFTSSGSVAGDDVNSGSVALPFTFNFYGVNYSNIFICTNGWVSFTSSSTNLTNYAFPSTTAPTSCISLLMHDLATSGFGSTGAGSCTYGVTGTAPNRKFVIYYNGIGNYSGGNTNTGQIILNESSNTIDILLGAVVNGTTSYNSTVGIQNQSGTIATTAATYNGTVVTVSTPAAYRFSPSFPTATYAWTPATGIASSASAVTTATVTATTTYTVTVTDPATGCNGTFTTTDTAVAQPTVALTTTQTSFCSGGQDSLIASASGGIGPITAYTWSGPGIATTTGTAASASFNPTVTATTSGLYTVSVAYAGAGCIPAVGVSESVTIAPDPVVTVSPSSTSLCSGSTLTLTGTLVSGGVGTPRYSWSGPGITTTTGTSSTSPVFTPTPSSGAYSLAVTYSGRGCDVANANTGTVNVYAIPAISLGASPSVCQPSTSASISYSSPTGSPIYYNITWGSSAITAGFSNITLGTLTGGSITLPIPGTSVTGAYSGTITVYNAGLCGSSTYAFSLTIYANPTATFVTPTTPCSGYATTIAFTGTSGADVDYTIDGGSTLTGTLTGGTFSFSTGALTSAHTYVLVNAHNPVCTTAVSTSFTITPTPMQWTGSVSTNWNTASNWTCGFVPGSSDDAAIPSGTSNAPDIAASASGTTRNLSIAAGANVNVNSSGTLNIVGNLTNNGNVTGVGTLTMNGTSAQTVSGKGSVRNFDVNNTAGVAVAAGSKMTVKSTLSVTSGSLATSDSVVLYSDSLGSARVPTLPSGSSITGNVIVNQYFTGGRRAYRFWAHPFNDFIPLSQVFQAIDISGLGGPANGFIYTATNAPSSYRYNPYSGNSAAPGDPGWKPFTSTYATPDSNKFKRYQGIRIYYRGAKGEGTSLSPYTPSPTVASQWGVLNQGNQNVPLMKGTSSGQDYNMVGNPYPSPVDIGTVVFNAAAAGRITGSAFYIWNPFLNTAGQFQAVNYSTGGGSPTAIPYYLQTNNAFQVRAAHDGDVLNFTESNKSATVSAAYSLMKEKKEYVSLYMYDANYHPFDMLYVQFNDNATDNEDSKFDAGKPYGADVNMYSLSADNHKLTIDARPFKAETVIPVAVSSSYAQDYIFRAENMAVPEGGVLYLHDKLLKQYVLLQQGTEYRFSVTSDNATQGEQRFELTMKPASTVAATVKGLEVSMTPNPTSDNVKLTFTQGAANNVSVRVMDLSGVSVYNKDLGLKQNGTISVPLNNMASGVYMVELTSGTEKVVQRLIKE